MTISVSELQRKISIIRHLKETLYVVDKKTNEVLATITPNKKPENRSITDELAGIFSDTPLPEKYQGDLDSAIADAYREEMEKKYGRR